MNFALLSITELIQFIFYRIGLKLISISGYEKFNKFLLEVIRDSKVNGYSIRRRGRLLCINIVNDKFNYLIRPNTSDFKVFKQVIMNKEYQPIINLINKNGHVSSINNIIDAGSNVGFTSLFLLKEFPNANIISIEPDKGNYSHQKKVVDDNLPTSSLLLLNHAIWKNNTDRLEVLSNFRDGESWSKSVEVSNTKTNFITALTLNDVRLKFGINSIIDILKLDVEGTELYLFQCDDFLEELEKFVRYFCIEVHEELNIKNKIQDQLIKRNFEITEIGETIFCKNNNLG